MTGAQNYFGESALANAHRWASIVFILLMFALTVLFALQEDNRQRNSPSRMPSSFWGNFHWACAGVMALALAFNMVSTVLGFWRLHTLTVVEAICAATFGASWLAKGLELPYLRAPFAPTHSETQQATAEPVAPTEPAAPTAPM